MAVSDWGGGSVLRKTRWFLFRSRYGFDAFYYQLGVIEAHEKINGRLEHLRGSALGFRNLTNYIVRSLLESSGFRPVLHSHP